MNLGDIIFQLFMILIPLVFIVVIIFILIMVKKQRKQLNYIEKKLDKEITDKRIK
ncbi:DUF4083 domain-containing protein [Peribacillus psychrosaccharolyticus]|uniref:DUF4083 domain-containing protein n=1 Tax=Peribacillus psychrosaccharolyticus TaxID=1407 RepID=UPI003D2AE36B